MAGKRKDMVTLSLSEGEEAVGLKTASSVTFVKGIIAARKSITSPGGVGVLCASPKVAKRLARRLREAGQPQASTLKTVSGFYVHIP